MNIGGNIKKYRELQGLTVEQLADKMGIGKAGIYKWEKNETTPSIESLTDVAKALDCRLIDLLGENHASVQKEPAVNENPLVDLGDAIRKVVEDNTEYLIIPKVVLEGKYRLVAIEQIEKDARELEERSAQIQGLHELIKQITHDITSRPINIQLTSMEKTK